SRGKFGGGAKVEILKGHKRYGNRRNAQKGSFNGGGNRAGINDVVAKIRSFVDSRDNQMGPYRQKASERKFHAIDRRSIHCKSARRKLLDPQRAMQRQCMTHGALRPIWRDRIDLADMAEVRF